VSYILAVKSGATAKKKICLTPSIKLPSPQKPVNVFQKRYGQRSSRDLQAKQCNVVFTKLITQKIHPSGLHQFEIKTDLNALKTLSYVAHLKFIQ